MSNMLRNKEVNTRRQIPFIKVWFIPYSKINTTRIYFIFDAI